MPEKSSQPGGEKEKSPMKEEETKKTNPPKDEDEQAAPTEEDKWKSPSEGDETIELPDEADFWRPPARFGSIPVEKEPLGWDKRQGYRKHFPRISLPFQIVERVELGHPAMKANRLVWGITCK